ncbi:MAG: hypothetical protein KatS3mg122_2925 [Caldimonas sp.]|nr:MAG: hypothetical protein KatS3mg122_2925 [Caldimonas sp.]
MAEVLVALGDLARCGGDAVGGQSHLSDGVAQSLLHLRQGLHHFTDFIIATAVHRGGQVALRDAARSGDRFAQRIADGAHQPPGAGGQQAQDQHGGAGSQGDRGLPLGLEFGLELRGRCGQRRQQVSVHVLVAADRCADVVIEQAGEGGHIALGAQLGDALAELGQLGLVLAGLLQCGTLGRRLRGRFQSCDQGFDLAVAGVQGLVEAAGLGRLGRCQRQGLQALDIGLALGLPLHGRIEFGLVGRLMGVEKLGG